MELLYEAIQSDIEACRGSDDDFEIILSLGTTRSSVWKAAAEAGVPWGQYLYGKWLAYRSGDLMDSRDQAAAANWCRRAANQGNAAAQYELANAYLYGTGVMQDYLQAVFWFRKAAEQGNAGAMYELGECYRWGGGVLLQSKLENRAIGVISITVPDGAISHADAATPFYRGPEAGHFT